MADYSGWRVVVSPSGSTEWFVMDPQASSNSLTLELFMGRLAQIASTGGQLRLAQVRSPLKPATTADGAEASADDPELASVIAFGVIPYGDPPHPHG